MAKPLNTTPKKKVRLPTVAKATVYEEKAIFALLAAAVLVRK